MSESGEDELDYWDWLIRHRTWSRERVNEALGMMPEKWPEKVPCWCHPFRDPAYEAREAARRLAEAEGRQRWIGDVKRRLGLVDEVHRCHVMKGSPEWIWSCSRGGCTAAGYFCPSQPGALAEALAHSRAYLPGPPEEIPVTELDLLALDARWDAPPAELEVLAAVLPGIGLDAVLAFANRTLTPCGDYCSICENFPCLGNHPPGETG